MISEFRERGFWKNLELFFDKLIIPALLVLLVIVIADLFFNDFKYEYENYFLYADLVVLFIFVGDLSFKFKKAKSFANFLSREWLEIIAVIPFFWIFRLIETIARVGELVQEIIHLVARGGRFFRLFAAINVALPRHERFREFMGKIPVLRKLEHWAEVFKHPSDE